jgi:hypothetical protein
LGKQLHVQISETVSLWTSNTKVYFVKVFDTPQKPEMAHDLQTLAFSRLSFSVSRYRIAYSLDSMSETIR